MSEERRTFYSNKATIGISLFDVRLFFMETNPLDAENPEKECCNIVMSPQHFKAFVKVVNDNLAAYERVFGPINLEANQEALAEIAVAQPDKKKEG